MHVAAIVQLWHIFSRVPECVLTVALMLQYCVRPVVCDLCIVAERCVLKQKLVLTFDSL